jgi:hypothetical protein
MSDLTEILHEYRINSDPLMQDQAQMFRAMSAGGQRSFCSGWRSPAAQLQQSPSLIRPQTPKEPRNDHISNENTVTDRPGFKRPSRNATKQTVAAIHTILKDVELRKWAVDQACGQVAAEIEGHVGKPSDTVTLARAIHAFLTEGAGEAKT